MDENNHLYPLSDAELFWVVRWEAEGTISDHERSRLNMTHPDRIERARRARDKAGRGAVPATA